jgi:pimeloyl-ACP methyl ester carboxylesterase
MTSATTLDETPVFFPCREATLFGIVTEPRGPARGIGVVVLSGGGTPLSTNVNRMSVRLCRQVSELGLHAFRFDYHGVGESGGASDRFHLANPFVADVEAALASLRSRGIERFVLIGSCFGARTALAAAAITADVEGLVLISPPVRDFEMGERTATRLATELSLGGYAREAFRWRNLRRIRSRWSRRLYFRLAREKLRAVARRGATSTIDAARYDVSSTVVQQLGDVVGTGTQTLVIFGDEDDLWADFERAQTAAAPEHAAALDLSVLPGVVHGLTDLACQDAVLEGIHRWLDERTTWPARSPVATAVRSELGSTDPVGG